MDTGDNVSDLHKRITHLISEVMGIDVDKFDKTKKLNTISEWDSFNNLMLITRMQETFKIEFTALDIEKAQTINDIYALVERKMK